MMKIAHGIIAAAALALVCQGGVAAQGRGNATRVVGTPPTSPVTGNAASGKKLYFQYACYSCHGYEGETGARTFVPNWPATLSTEQTFIGFLRGRANVAPAEPSTSMPNYAATTLTDAQAKDIYAYIRSFRNTAPPTDQIAAFKDILSSARKPYKK